MGPPPHTHTNGDIYFCYFGVVEGLSVTGKGLLRATILKEHQYTLHATGGHVEVDIPKRVALVYADFAMAEDAIVQDCEACGKLVANHAGQLWLGHHVVLQTDVLDVVRGVGISHGPDHAVVVVEGEFDPRARSDRTACGSRVDRNPVGCRIDCYKYRQWPCLLQQMHPYFQY